LLLQRTLAPKAVIASEAKQSGAGQGLWIASAFALSFGGLEPCEACAASEEGSLLALLAMTAETGARQLLQIRVWRIRTDHHDDPHPPYRFGLLPEPLTAPPSGGWKMNVLMAIRPEAFP
jgi:hypothetical protein